ncbi:hypothetical protein TWF694_007566 [Orbilia ellipsospora]|uniref:Mitochondrial thiamine pyrophosphate carrier 1 n=1 Tax=Orbilia ellipsospora TaxID=2528407 RepID=A0AAV9XJK4_9PEZI
MSRSENDGTTAAASEIVAGVSAGFIATIVCHPLDIIKTRLQVHRPDTVKTWGGSLAVARELFDEARASGTRPLRAIYRGISPNVVGNTASWGLYFLWYDQFKKRAAKYRGTRGQDLTSLDYLLTSGAAGVASAALTNPLWVVKTRMLTSGSRTPGAYRDLTDGLYRIATEEGFRGLFRGFLPSLFGVLQAAIQFMAYENLKIWRASSRMQSLDSQHRESPAAVAGRPSRDTIGHERYRQPALSQLPALSNSDYMVLSASSKVFAGALTYPYQVIRSRLQTHDAATVYSSARNAVFQTWQSQGLAGFYRGLGPNLVRVLPATCITFVVYENVRRIF